MTSRKLSLFALSIALAFASPLAAAPALVGHNGLAAESIDADGVKAVLLGKKVTLAGARVVIVIAKNSETQEQFLKSAVGMTTSQFQNHWRRLFMTGGGSAPSIVENEDEAAKAVAGTPGAVAVLDDAKAGGLAILSAN